MARCGPVAKSPISCRLPALGEHSVPSWLWAQISQWGSQAQELDNCQCRWNLGLWFQVLSAPAIRHDRIWCSVPQSHFLPYTCGMEGSMIVWTMHQIPLCLYLYLHVWQRLKNNAAFYNRSCVINPEWSWVSFNYHWIPFLFVQKEGLLNSDV